MSQATELIARQMAAGASIGKIWGTLVYNVKDTAYGAKGDGVVDDTTALINAVAAASVNGGMVVFPPGTYKTGNFTTPSNVTLVFLNGAKLSISSGATVTINGPIDAGLHHIFSGLGTVAGSIDVPQLYPQWWGAKGDGIADDIAAIQAAMDAAHSIGGGTVFFPQTSGNTYLTGNTLIFYSNVKLESAGGVVIKLKDGAASNLTTPGKWLYGNGLSNIQISKGITFDGGVQTTIYDMLTLSTCSNIDVDGIQFQNGYGTALNLNGTTDYAVSNIKFKEIKGISSNPGEGIYALGSKRGVMTNLLGYGLDDHLIYLDGNSSNYTEDISITNAIAVNCGRAPFYSSGFNIYQDCRKVKLTACHTYNCGLGFRVAAGASDIPTDIILADCDANTSTGGTSAHGFVFSGISGGSSMRIKLSNCRAYNCGNATPGVVGYGFILTDVNDIDMTNCDASKSNDDGVKLLNIKRFTFNGGKVTDNSRRTSTPAFSGFKLEGTNDDLYIANAVTYDSLAAGKLQNYGFNIDNGTTNAIIEGGKHTGNATGAWAKGGTVPASVQIIGIQANGTRDFVIR